MANVDDRGVQEVTEVSPHSLQYFDLGALLVLPFTLLGRT